VLSPSLLVVHDTGRGGQDNETELTGREKLDNPLLEVAEFDIVSRRDTSSFVDTSLELDNYLSGTVVVNLLELANVFVLLHNAQELDNDFGGRPNKDLPLSSLLGVVDSVQAIIED